VVEFVADIPVIEAGAIMTKVVDVIAVSGRRVRL
jgi:hypothetical protein